MFNKKNRYCSQGINNSISIRLQLLLWEKIDNLKEKTTLDYLQIFRLKKENNSLIIEHEQEVPQYKATYNLNCSGILIDEDLKIYVIDDGSYSTMILADEY